MALEESDREDLIREATGLVDRVEFKANFLNESIVVGFRRDGSVSFFFGQARVYQFNIQNELRRGYLDGKLLKSERGKLVRLTRNRTNNQVQLVRHELSDSEQVEFVTTAIEYISKLKFALQSKTAIVLRSVSSQEAKTGNGDSESGTAEVRVLNWLNTWPGEITIAATPQLSRVKPKP